MKSEVQRVARTCARLCLIGLMGCSSARSGAEESHLGGEILLKVLGAFADKDRPEWDQEKAETILKDLIAKENAGDFGWEKISWETDARKVAAKAKKEKKPILAYLFLKRDVGPKDAPC